MRADLLLDDVDGLDEALAAVDRFDASLVGGLLRPQPGQADGPAGLAVAVAGTPLAARVAEAAEKTVAGAGDEEHFVALAAARTALLGAAHDALVLRVDEVVGRPAADDVADGPADAGAAGAPAHAPNLMVAARSWLCDLARAGWRSIDHDLVGGAAPVVSAMLADPAQRRLATLLDGFAAELAACCPGAALERVPVRRWADLWSRALLLTLPGAASAPATGSATGRLLPLGVDVHEHPTAVQAQVHAVFEPADGGAPRLVRASVSAPKPDTVVGAGLWQLLRPHMSLLAAVGEGCSMELAGMPVTAEGDLLWDDACARPGAEADVFATARVALPAAAGYAVAPLDRHPARIAVPVLVEGYRVREEAGGRGEDGEREEAGGREEHGGREEADGERDTVVVLDVAGCRLRVDTDRVPAAGPLTAKAVTASGACLGLLRWDAGEFLLQPLAVERTSRGKSVAVHAGAWAGGTTDKAGARAEKAATDAVKVLRERAGKLLRK
ncbi:hypothetical protein [Streptomyces parvulus]|uniref:hypothetical protein n=1 Tax=Streptomyces parvulus TaxID=146923 RepID=UPI00381C2674